MMIRVQERSQVLGLKLQAVHRIQGREFCFVAKQAMLCGIAVFSSMHSQSTCRRRRSILSIVSADVDVTLQILIQILT